MTRHRLLKTVLLLGMIVVPPFQLKAEELKTAMWKVAASLNELQNYLYSEQQFSNDENAPKIGAILDSLEGGFHQASQFSQHFRDEPGFVATLDVTRQLIKDANQRFREGQRSYARWRLRNLPASCVSCHTRFRIADGGFALQPSKNIPVAQQAEFLLATRQFDKALVAYEKLLFTPSTQRREEMGLWLLIEVRVKQDPKAASAVLNKLLHSGSLSPYEEELVQDWLSSMKRWSAEVAAKMPTLVRAERLIRAAGELSAQEGEHRGTVELLRATALLHAALDKGELQSSNDRQQALYLLGSAYADLPMRVIPEMPDMLLEQAIRTEPGNAVARKAYRSLEQFTNRAFSGISGTEIPADVRLHLKELHDLAYEVPQPPSRI